MGYNLCARVFFSSPARGRERYMYTEGMRARGRKWAFCAPGTVKYSGDDARGFLSLFFCVAVARRDVGLLGFFWG